MEKLKGIIINSEYEKAKVLVKLSQFLLPSKRIDIDVRTVEKGANYSSFSTEEKVKLNAFVH